MNRSGVIVMLTSRRGSTDLHMKAEYLAKLLIDRKGGGGLVSQQDAQVAKIISGGSGDDGVAERVEKRISIEAGERLPHGFGASGTGIDLTTAGTKEGAAIDYGSGGRTVAVDAVGAGAQHGNVLSRYLFGAGEGELLVASADATVADGHGHLAAGDQADARYCAAQFAQAVEQVVGGFVVGPVVAGVIDFDGETGAGGGCGGFIDGHFVREHGPPASADESGVVGFGRLVESMLAEKTRLRISETDRRDCI